MATLEEKVVSAFHKVLDVLGIPKEHPARDAVNAVATPDTETEEKPDA